MQYAQEQQATVSVEVNPTDKQLASELFDHLGLSPSTAINIFIKKSIAEGGMPFEVKDPFYNTANQAELQRRFNKLNRNQTQDNKLD
ncbi:MULTISPECIES: type II toxin-antitoxin system RelB/DinJ family antitoxin [Lactiplantibacillus]|uniref:Type II toxin-antitoxin system RelB/DinJ family antitoxin n=1 Tax=Lactiplantibacillus pentosus TaxID=1589 RepID=A0AAW8VUI1_LACPE|nr:MULTISPECIES: type II toxin-antitoxin system RelB/DinJ family antitoxin [Lactiplantibacillus]MBU7472727.1 type II toxin-antitoxin system RelB/DinJ family antitoxin [Lactiplantibacillus pentosus]MBU7527985.1 type II toxin-antitoxin system RelB/DinJ family antitoxin [Lactiplantibacillus pentosus]MCM8607692.1 type II toxin-antitoxin system RelB/DinJ family antitoxin [Lactiplantibacillus sp. B652]MCT3303353.1 type II toxin-antitoxin system RelB/DinJ family antitoxin [Lactiplantibacillus pentosus